MGQKISLFKLRAGPIANIPTEILGEIFSHVDEKKDQLAISLTCRWFHLVNGPHLYYKFSQNERAGMALLLRSVFGSSQLASHVKVLELQEAWRKGDGENLVLGQNHDPYEYLDVDRLRLDSALRAHFSTIKGLSTSCHVEGSDVDVMLYINRLVDSALKYKYWGNMALCLLILLPNLENLTIKRFDDPFTEVTEFFTCLLEARQQFPVTKEPTSGLCMNLTTIELKSMTRMYWRRFEIANVLPILLFPSLRSFRCQGIQGNRVEIPAERVISLESLALLQCAVSAPSLGLILRRCKILKHLSIEFSPARNQPGLNLYALTPRLDYPSILESIHHLKHSLESVMIIDDIKMWDDPLLEDHSTAIKGFADFVNLEKLKLETGYLQHPIIAPSGTQQTIHKFSLQDLPAKLHDLTVNNIHSPQCKDLLELNAPLIESIPNLKTIHFVFDMRFKHIPGEPWRDLSYQYWKKGITVSYDFRNKGLREQERVTFKHVENETLLSNEEVQNTDALAKDVKAALFHQLFHFDIGGH